MPFKNISNESKSVTQEMTAPWTETVLPVVVVAVTVVVAVVAVVVVVVVLSLFSVITV